MRKPEKQPGMDARVKIILCLSFILGVVSTNPKDLVTPLYFFPVLIAASIISRVPLNYVINRAAAVIPFTLFVALGILVTGKEGGMIFLSVLMKSILSVSAVSLLVASTSFQDLIKGFRGLHVPNIMLLIISFMHRYQDVIINEVKRMETAMLSRGGSRGGLLNLRAAGNIIGNLFIRSYHRSDRVYVAMTSRGFDSKRTWSQ